MNVKKGSQIGKASKKIYTVPDGEYLALWQGYFCWIYDDNGKIIYRFETTTRLQGRERVIVIVDCPHIKIYEIKKH